jgi:hypothetical protein
MLALALEEELLVEQDNLARLSLLIFLQKSTNDKTRGTG